MKANELRIGNRLQPDERHRAAYGNNEAIVTAIYEDKFIVCNHYPGKWFEPIPLTEEWLPRLGFPKDRDTMNLLFDYIIYFERQQNSLYLCNNQTKVQYVIEWVHEAQNLYFALTGEELTIS